MAFKDFPDQLQIKILDGETNNAGEMGSFTVTDATELSNIRVCMLKHGNAVGSEILRLKLSLSNDVTRAFITSSDLQLSDVSTDEYFLGWFNFEFARKHLDPNLTYYAFVEYENYTRNADTFYLAFAFDDVFGVNDFNASDDFGAAMQIVGYR